ncbi:MAG: hypothetical protein AAB325_07590 [Pseudomonadota bacterium]
MKNGFATSSYPARRIEYVTRFHDKTGKAKVSTQTVALILAHPGTPILSKMNVATARDSICTICHHLNLNPRALLPIRSIIWTSQPDLNALRPGSFHFWKILYPVLLTFALQRHATFDWFLLADDNGVDLGV